MYNGVHHIVSKLLEADVPQEVDPNDDPDEVDTEILYGVGDDDMIARQNKDVVAALEHAPDSFRYAFVNGDEATWETDPDYNWWPVQDYDDGTYTAYMYSTTYVTADGKLYQEVNEVDMDGNSDNAGSEYVGTDEWRRMLDHYALYRWYESLAEYYEWVTETGTDPLRFLLVAMVTRSEHKWIVGFTQEGERARFWKAREVGVPGGSPPAITDFTQLPEEVRQYVNVDAAGLAQDATWTEIVEMAQGPDDDERPVMKQAQDGTNYAEFSVKFKSSVENPDYVDELKAEAAARAKQARSTARKRRKDHRKQPRYVV